MLWPSLTFSAASESSWDVYIILCAVVGHGARFYLGIQTVGALDLRHFNFAGQHGVAWVGFPFDSPVLLDIPRTPLLTIGRRRLAHVATVLLEVFAGIELQLKKAKRRPAGQTGVFKLLQTTLYFDLHRSNACCLLHNISSEDPEQIAVFNSPVLQQYPKNGCGLNLCTGSSRGTMSPTFSPAR